MDSLILVSENPQVISAFKKLEKSRSFAFDCLTYERWELGTAEGMIYLDISSLDQKALTSILDRMEKSDCPWAIVDPDRVCEDVAELFHRGACDYLVPISGQKIKVKRIQRALEFFRRYKQTTAPSEQPLASEIPPPKKAKSRSKNETKLETEPAASWKQVKNGREYSFCFLYVQLEPSQEWQGKSGFSHQEQMQNAFHDLIASRIKDYDGRIWMWNDWGGLVLFPLDMQNCEVVVLGIRMMLNRLHVSIEGGPFETILNYSFVFHVGKTKYQDRGKTGTIISEDVNFIFHLGGKEAELNYVYLSDTVYQMLPQKLQALFSPQGEFEGRNIFRMKSPFRVVED